MTELTQLIDQLKNHIAENDGEVVYWGEKIAPHFDVALVDGAPSSPEADQLLNKILNAIGLDRFKVFISTLPFQPKKLAAVRPRFVVLLGQSAIDAVLKEKTDVKSHHGQWTLVSFGSEMTDMQVLPTFHPSELLKDESLKKLVWEDMKKLRDRLAHG